MYEFCNLLICNNLYFFLFQECVDTNPEINDDIDFSGQLLVKSGILSRWKLVNAQIKNHTLILDNNNFDLSNIKVEVQGDVTFKITNIKKNSVTLRSHTKEDLAKWMSIILLVRSKCQSKSHNESETCIIQ